MHTGSDWRLSRWCYNISHLTWQPYILLTASVHNFPTLNKLKVPLCNLTLETTQVRNQEISACQVVLGWPLLVCKITTKQSPAPHQIQLERAERRSARPPGLSETRFLQQHEAQAISCPGLSFPKFLAGQMDFHGNNNSNGCTCDFKPTLQLRSHVFAPQHGGIRASEDLKKKYTGKSTHNFKLYFPIYLPLSWKTLVVVFQL